MNQSIAQPSINGAEFSINGAEFSINGAGAK